MITKNIINLQDIVIMGFKKAELLHRYMHYKTILNRTPGCHPWHSPKVCLACWHGYPEIKICCARPVDTKETWCNKQYAQSVLPKQNIVDSELRQPCMVYFHSPVCSWQARESPKPLPAYNTPWNQVLHRTMPPYWYIPNPGLSECAMSEIR